MIRLVKRESGALSVMHHIHLFKSERQAAHLTICEFLVAYKRWLPEQPGHFLASAWRTTWHINVKAVTR